MRIKFIVYMLFIALLSGCSENRFDTKRSLELAGKNKIELEKVLNHYPKGSEEERAAKFLIANMRYHKHYEGDIINKYKEALDTSAIVNPNSIWLKIKDQYPDNVRLTNDVETIKSDFLIEAINEAFISWRGTKWSKKVTFDTFLEYILPYSVNNEPLYLSKKYLREKYGHFLDLSDSPKEIFDQLYCYIRTSIKTSNLMEYPHKKDAQIMDIIKMGNCEDKASYIVSVARALGIPTAIDHTPMWANFSTLPHSWATYVGLKGNESYIISRDDSVSSIGATIDASLFQSKHPLNNKDTLYKIDSIKVAPKILRQTYSPNLCNNIKYDKNYIHFRDILFKDVSKEYLFKGQVDFHFNKHINDNVYLCYFLTGSGWKIIDAKYCNGSYIRFNNLPNQDVVCLPIISLNGEQKALDNPVICYKNGKRKRLIPLHEKETIKLFRKYILMAYWIDKLWESFTGFTFEGSNDRNFKEYDTLHIIDHITYGISSVLIENDKEYRYLRARSAKGKRQSIAEVAFFETDSFGKFQELCGEVIFRREKYNDAMKGFDKDYSTVVRFKNAWIGYDLGEEKRGIVSKIEFCPQTDTNMIIPGYEYELFYFDKEWISLGVNIAISEKLIYDNVPKNSLLWLRCLSNGKEERIFTYEDDKQVWW